MEGGGYTAQRTSGDGHATPGGILPLGVVVGGGACHSAPAHRGRENCGGVGEGVRREDVDSFWFAYRHIRKIQLGRHRRGVQSAIWPSCWLFSVGIN